MPFFFYELFCAPGDNHDRHSILPLIPPFQLLFYSPLAGCSWPTVGRFSQLSWHQFLVAQASRSSQNRRTSDLPKLKNILPSPYLQHATRRTRAPPGRRILYAPFLKFVTTVAVKRTKKAIIELERNIRETMSWRKSQTPSSTIRYVR